MYTFHKMLIKGMSALGLIESGQTVPFLRHICELLIMRGMGGYNLVSWA